MQNIRVSFFRRLFFAGLCLLIFAARTPTVAAKEAESANILWSVDWSSDGKYFAVGGDWVGIFDAKTYEKTSTPSLSKSKAASKVRWHPRQNQLAVSGGPDGVTAIYNLATDHKIPLVTKEGTRGIAWNPAGDRLATAGSDGSLQIWQVDGTLLHTTRPAKAKSLTGVAWHPAEDKILTIGEFITLYDGAGKILKQVSHRPKAKGFCLLLCVEWHPSGDSFVVGDYGNSTTGDSPVLQFWSADCNLLKTIPVENGAEFRNVSWNRDGSLLASASDAMRIWSKDGELRQVGKSPDLLWGIRWNCEGDQILTSSFEGRVTLWNNSGKISRKIIEVSDR